MTAPMMHNAHPILPKNVSVSFRKMDESTALHPRGQYRIFQLDTGASPDNNRERSKGRDEDGLCEGVGDKVEDLSHDHEGHASPPHGRLEVRMPIPCRCPTLLLCTQQPLRSARTDASAYAQRTVPSHVLVNNKLSRPS